jgi:hypothetical protein
VSRRPVALLAITLLFGLAAGAKALQNQAVPENQPENQVAPVVSPAAPAPSGASSRDDDNTAPKPSAAPPVKAETPMAQRVAVLGLLNKRNGIARDVTIKPGQAVRIGDVIIRLRACETTQDWEPQKLTGAFAQVDVRGRDEKWRRVFSGWLYKESPSLNMVQHPIYDVWAKSCAMRHPDMGPDTITATSVVSSAAKRSSAKKSADDSDISPPPAPRAPSNNPT